MWAKIILATLCLSMIGLAFRLRPEAERRSRPLAAAGATGVRLMTWNLGYANLEDDTRAHTEDLRAVAETILANRPDAVALQELEGPAQLAALLGYLGHRYRGEIAQAANADRVEAVLVREGAARFETVVAGDRYAMSATFLPARSGPEVVLISAHADAYSAARRRILAGHLVDWARTRPGHPLVFTAGDFNFELSPRNQSDFFSDDLKQDSEAYSYILKYYRDLGREAGPTALNERRIDYIFGPLGTVLARPPETLRGASVGRMDHWPLVIDVALTYRD